MLIWHFHPVVGGAERQCLRLSRELARRGFPITVLTKSLPGTFESETLDGITIRRIHSLCRFRAAVLVLQAQWFPSSAVGWIPKVGRFMARQLGERLPRYAFVVSALWSLHRRRREMDILHVHEAHWIASIGAQFGAWTGKPVLIKEASSGAYLQVNFALQFWPRLTRKIAVFIALSRRIAEEIQKEGVAENRIRLIPNGIDLPDRVWISTQARPGQVVFVGNLGQQPYKGVDVLLRAWVAVASKRPDARLSLLGGGEGRELKALARELGIEGSVVFLGAVQNVEERLLESSLFILPSRLEGMSNALLEAMALGVPCVSTRVSGSEDLIRSGENGILIPSEDPQALAEAVLFGLDNLDAAANMGARARQTIAESYTITSIAERYGELYRSIWPAVPGREKSTHAG